MKDSQKLLEQMRSAYLSFETYSDVGTVGSAPELGSDMEFQTYFKRPECFRFSWLSWHPYFGKSKPPTEAILWSDGRTHRNRFFDEVLESESLRMMVAGATGISRGSVYMILNLLVPNFLELRRAWETIETSSELLSDEAVNGVDCFHILAKDKTGEDTELWLDKLTLVIRRVKQTTVMTEDKAQRIGITKNSAPAIETLKREAEKHGLPPEFLNEALAQIAKPVEPRTYSHTYNYTEVLINQDVVDSLFQNENGS